MNIQSTGVDSPKEMEKPSFRRICTISQMGRMNTDSIHMLPTGQKYLNHYLRICCNISQYPHGVFESARDLDVSEKYRVIW